MKRVSPDESNHNSRSKIGFYSDKVSHRLGDRRISLYRRNDVEQSSWFLCVYLREEKRQYRISLKTTDLRQAKRKSEDVLIDLLGKIRSGEKILSTSWGDVLRMYRSEQERLVSEGQTAEKTSKSQSYRINHGTEFLASQYPAGLNTKITAIDGSVFNQYLFWRRAKRLAKGADLTIRLDVVRDELLSIRKVFHFARAKKLCSERNIPSWDFVVEREGAKRKRVTNENYRDFLNCLKSWKGKSSDAKDRYHRELLFHFILVVANTGLRTGELLGLRNKDVEIHEKANECVLNIQAETSKVRKGRRITVNPSLGGHPTRTSSINYLIRWIATHQLHRDKSDYVFSPYSDGAKSARDVYYHAYKKLRIDLAEIDLGWFDTYHCRHFWITNRLYAGEPIHLVAKAAGTSTKEIESTYSNVMTELTTREFGKKRLVFGDGNYSIVATNTKSKRSQSK